MSDISDIANAIFEAAGGEDSEIQQPKTAIIGHATTGDIWVDPEHLPGRIWLHDDVGAYLTADDSASGRDDSPAGTYPAILQPGAVPSGFLKYGTSVIVRIRRGQLVVVGCNDGPAAEFLAGVGEYEVTQIDIPQFSWGLIAPTATPSMTVVVHHAVYPIAGTLYDVAPLALTLDASGIASGQAKAVQIVIDPTTPALETTTSSAFTDNRDATTGLSDHAALFANYPDTVANNRFHLGWVKLYGGMKEVRIEDIYHAPELFSKGDASGFLTESDLPSVAFANKFGAKFTAGAAASRPATAAGVGDIYFSTDTGVMNVCLSGTAWTQYAIFDTRLGSEGYLLKNGSNAMSGELNHSTHAALFTETTKPATPGTNAWKLYFKTDGLYALDDAGAETGPLAAGGGGGSALTYTRGDDLSGVGSLTSSAQYFTLNFTDDPDTFEDVSNTDRCDIPSGKGGRYLVVATFAVYESADTGSGTGYNQVAGSVQKNGTTLVGDVFSFLDASSTEANEVDFVFTDIINLVDTDYIRFGIRRVSGSDTLDAQLRSFSLTKVA